MLDPPAVLWMLGGTWDSWVRNLRLLHSSKKAIVSVFSWASVLLYDVKKTTGHPHTTTTCEHPSISKTPAPVTHSMIATFLFCNVTFPSLWQNAWNKQCYQEGFILFPGFGFCWLAPGLGRAPWWEGVVEHCCPWTHESEEAESKSKLVPAPFFVSSCLVLFGP